MSKCIGCGITKQTTNPNLSGYVIKLENEYCLRCFKIKNYNQLISQEINAEEFIDKLKNLIKEEKNNDIEFFYILDIFDLEGSRVIELEKIISRYKVSIIINKIDLLPKAVKLSKIRKYITDVFNKTELKNANIILNTTMKLNFVDSLLNKVKKTNSNKYFVGSSNVGKSTIINSLLKANNLIPQIVESKYFNTTLDFIKIKLSSDHNIFDTPGIARNNSIANQINHKEWEYIYFNKEVSQITYQLLPNNSIFMGTACWIDYIDAKQGNSFHFYANKQVKLHRTNIKNSLTYWDKNKHIIKPSITEGEIVTKVFEFSQRDLNKELDITISGLGWFSFKVKEPMKIVVNIPTNNNKVNISLRRSLI